MATVHRDQDQSAASISYPALFHRWLKEQGYDADEIFSSAGIELDWFDDPEKRITLQHFETLTRQAFEVTRNPALGLDFGSQIPLSAHGYLGFAAQASESAEEAVRMSCTFASTRFSGVEVELEHRNRELAVVVSSSFEDPVLDRYTLEAVCAAMLTSLDVLRRMNGGWGPEDAGPVRRVEFGFGEPAYHEAYRRVFSGIGLGFDAASTSIVFDIERLRTPFSFGDRVSRQLAIDQCRAELDTLTVNESHTDRVLRLLRRDPAANDSLDRISTQLGMSTRVLSRRLSEEHANFRDLRDRVRKQLALRYLQTTRLTISEIAHRLGYEHPNNFGRAFKKWTGKSPGAYR